MTRSPEGAEAARAVAEASRRIREAGSVREAFEAMQAAAAAAARARGAPPDAGRRIEAALEAASAGFRSRVSAARREIASRWKPASFASFAGSRGPVPEAAFLGMDARFRALSDGRVFSALETLSDGSSCVYALAGLGIHAPGASAIETHRRRLLEQAPESPAGRAARRLGSSALAALFDRNVARLFATRLTMIERNRIPQELAVRLAVLPGLDYDGGRRRVMGLVRSMLDGRDGFLELRELMIPELRALLRRLLIDHRHAAVAETESLFGACRNFEDHVAALDEKRSEIASLEGRDASEIYREALAGWEGGIRSQARALFEAIGRWTRRFREEREALFDDPALEGLRGELAREDIHALTRHLFPRLYEDVPHLVDLRKPMILLVGGATGTGKSTLSRILSERLGIHLYFSADLLREVQRGVTSPESHPALHRSSFEASPLLPGFFEQGYRISEAVEAVIRRLSTAGVSAVIEGIPLVPGFLDESCYETANVVHLVVTVPEEAAHAERFEARGAEAAGRGRERYLKRLSAIRTIQAAMADLAGSTDAFLLENRDLEAAIGEAEAWVSSPFIDRFRAPDHPDAVGAKREVERRGEARPRRGTRKAPVPGEAGGFTFLGELDEGEKRAFEALGTARAKRLAYRHLEEVGRSVRAFLDVRNILFDWVRQLSLTPGHNYDEARRKVGALLQEGGTLSPSSLEGVFFRRYRETLEEFMARDGAGELARTEGLDRVQDLDGLEAWVKSLDRLGAGLQERYLFWIRKRRETIREEVERTLAREAELFRLHRVGEAFFKADPDAAPALEAAGLADALSLARRLCFHYRPSFPGAKDLSRPTIVLLGGAPATGKDSVGRALKQALAITTCLRTDLIREVMRRHLPEEAWPSLHASSLALPPEGELAYHRKYLDLFDRPRELIEFKERWRREVLGTFFSNVAVSFHGVLKVMDRLVKENQSAIIEGPAVLPGALPAPYFGKANIIQAVLCVEDEHEHYKRFIARGLPREGFLSNRFIHNELKAMARSAGAVVVNNDEIEGTVERVVRVAAGGLCDRPRGTKHPDLSRVMAAVNERLRFA